MHEWEELLASKSVAIKSTARAHARAGAKAAGGGTPTPATTAAGGGGKGIWGLSKCTPSEFVGFALAEDV